MANVIINDTNLTNIAQAIRSKNGTSTTYKVSEMASAITNLPTGGGSGSLEPTVLSGDLEMVNYQGRFDEFIQKNPTLFSTANVTNFEYGFSGSTLTRIPFSINFNGSQVANGLTNAFSNMSNLEEMPEIHGGAYGGFNETFAYTSKLKVVEFADDLNVSGGRGYPMGNIFRNSGAEEIRGKMPPIAEGLTSNGVNNCGYMFAYCNHLRTIPYDFFSTVPNTSNITSSSSGAYAFLGCYSLRGAAPNIKFMETGNKQMYYATFSGCASLDRIINLPVYSQALTSNGFTNCFADCARLEQLTFERNEDGTPKTANWSNQTIDLSVGVGYAPSTQIEDYILNYNSGITADKEIYYNSASSSPYSIYTQLKDDPDWYTLEVGFSRYDRKSAVETINSLPDVSSGSGNTIKFNQLAGNMKGSMSDATDMSKLSSSEIAVATAKGWTVTLV